MIKRSLSILMVMALLFAIVLTGALSIEVSAETEYRSGNYTYRLVGSNAIITDCNGLNFVKDVTIPSRLDGYPVTGIASSYSYDGVFQNCYSMTSLTIPDSITVIGEFAFQGCTSLKYVTIPDSLTKIYYNAFDGCTNLQSVYIDDLANWCQISFENEKSNPLYYADNLYINDVLITDLVIPDGVTSIRRNAFRNCTNLTSVVIPDSVERIEMGAFEGCTSLVEMVIPFVGSSRSANGTNDAVLGYIFGYTTEQSSLDKPPFGTTLQYTYHHPYNGTSSDFYYYIPKSLRSVTVTDDPLIPSNAFRNCSMLTSIVIPNSVTSIGELAFYNCIGLTSITIPDSVTSIGGLAFDGCSALASINIPDSVTSIGTNAFYGCIGLTDVYITDVAAWCGIEFGIVSNPLSYAGNLYIDGTLTTNIVIPDSVTSLGNYVFNGCASLTSIIIPDSVTSIGECAFSRCTGLTSITVPDSVTSIGDGAFYGCSSLQKITLPYIGATRDGTSKTHFGYIFGADYYTSNCDYVPSSLKEVVITKATSIGSSAFNGCTGLVSVAIPDSVTNIGGYAFYDCNSLMDVFYSGTKVQSSTMTVAGNNSCLTNAEWHYNLCAEEWHEFSATAGLTCGICGYSIAPSKPIVEAKTNSSVTLVLVENYEYSKDGSVWQDSPVFANLAPLTTYVFYQRVKESSVALASEASEGTSVAFKAAQLSPNAPIVSSFTDTTVTLVPITNGEYSKDGIVWQTSNVFSNLLQGTRYVFYQRYAETDVYEASDKSSEISIVTEKFKQLLIPDAPTVQSVTESRVTLTPVEGCEYSKGGFTWQSSNVFTGLSCGTEYTFYQRYKETESTFAGGASRPTKAKTDKGTQSKPSAPTLKSKMHNSVTLAAVSGYEYSRDGINWQTSNTFVGLDPETNYLFYQRRAETDRYYASVASVSLTVKTNEAPACVYDPALHIYSYDCDPDCNICGGTRSVGHVYTTTCDVECNRCGHIRTIQHTYSGGCDNECNICGVPRKTSESHTYDHNSDAVCNVCGYERIVTAPKNGWVSENGKWAFYENGLKLTKQWKKDSVGWVYLGGDGYMLTNSWCRDSVGWCYVGADGYAVTNCWKKDSVGWCYLNANGSMTKNAWVKDGGKWYFLDKNGYMVSNVWKKDSKGWVYLGASGAMLTNSWCTDSKGWCYVGADGYAVTNCWKKDSHGWIWLNSNGSMTKSAWVKDGGKWYYLDGNGYMLASASRYIGGKTYHFNASGACTNP